MRAKKLTKTKKNCKNKNEKILTSIILSVFLILQSLKENVVYFQSPSEIKILKEISKKKN